MADRKDDSKKDDLQQKVAKLRKAAEKEHEGAAAAEAEGGRVQMSMQEMEDKLLRAVAEMQNMKRRVGEEKRQFAVFANQALILEVLQIVQSFNLSAAHLPEDLKGSDWVKGVLAIDQQLNGLLDRQGVKEIACSVGDKVDPNKHEVVMKGPGEEGKVVEVFEKGYEMNGRVLKPVRVKAGGL